tara:strand:+ start:198 stop:437 length:240 start_codon:yes stop_codon:yes gene_type:complete
VHLDQVGLRLRGQVRKATDQDRQRMADLIIHLVLRNDVIIKMILRIGVSKNRLGLMRNNLVISVVIAHMRINLHHEDPQ